MSNVFVLTGYACNGKTSLLPALEWNLKLKYPKKEIIIINEPVGFTFDASSILSTKEILKDFKIRQTSFLASALAQLSIIDQFMYKCDYIILCDRSMVDVLIFSLMDELTKEEFKNEFEEIERIIAKKFPYVWHLNNFDYFYILPPSDVEVVKKCFNKKERKDTLKFDKYYEKEKKYREYYKHVISKSNINTFKHPTDNTYVLYSILDKISREILLEE